MHLPNKGPGVAKGIGGRQESAQDCVSAHAIHILIAWHEPQFA